MPNKLASSVDAIAISRFWNYHPLTDRSRCEEMLLHLKRLQLVFTNSPLISLSWGYEYLSSQAPSPPQLTVWNHSCHNWWRLKRWQWRVPQKPRQLPRWGSPTLTWTNTTWELEYPSSEEITFYNGTKKWIQTSPCRGPAHNPRSSCSMFHRV